MKMISLKTAGMGIVLMLMALSMTGCGIPVKLSETVDLVKDIEVPALPEVPEEIEVEIPDEVREMYPEVDWDNPEDALAELNEDGLEYEREEEFCDLPDLQKIKNEAQARLPEILAKRIEVREVIVESIRFIADMGNFNSIIELVDVLTVDGQEFTFTITDDNDLGTVLTLTPDPPLDLAGLINDPDFNGCIKNSLSITGKLPEEEIHFKAVLDLAITLYLRIL